MRYRHKKKRTHLKATLVSSLSIASHVAVIFGTMMMVLDAVHHW
jgi:hypothetical protein